MLIFVKFGGSLITNKNIANTFLPERMQALAHATRQALAHNSDLSLLLGHGSGSFGHFAAREFDTINGVHTPTEWQGFAQVGRVARELNSLVTHSLAGADVPVWSVQPSASATCQDGQITQMATAPIRTALQKGLVPLVHGDVAFDTVRGGTIISTETVFFHLTSALKPTHIFLLGEVAGVLDEQDEVIPQITPDTLPAIMAMLGGSHGVDVTGGMASKVRDMAALAQKQPGLHIHIMSGLDAALLQTALANPQAAPGTVITADR